MKDASQDIQQAKEPEVKPAPEHLLDASAEATKDACESEVAIEPKSEPRYSTKHPGHLLRLSKKELTDAFFAAAPIMLGYIALGIPCGILGAEAGMSLVQVSLLSLFMYSGSGQYMIAGMTITGTPILTLAITTSLVSSRQMLYAAALAPKFTNEPKLIAFLFANSVTDESFGVVTDRYENDPEWNNYQSYHVNAFSHITWILSNMLGVLIGAVLSIDTGLASFAMTAIFLCLFITQVKSKSHLIVGFVTAMAVIICKYVGLSHIAIIAGALVGVIFGTVYFAILKRGPKTQVKEEKVSSDEIDANKKEEL